MAETDFDLELLSLGAPESGTPEVLPESETTPTAVEPTTADTTETPIEDEGVPYEELTPREKALMAQLDELRSITPTETPVVPTEPAVAPTPHNFMDGLDLDEVLSTPENFNKLLVAVYQKGMNEAKQLAAEQIMQSLPETISTYVTRHITMTGIVEDFYKQNADLAQVKKTVAQVANTVASEHPEMDLQGVFKEAATRTRKMLGLKALPPKPTAINSFTGRSRSSGSRGAAQTEPVETGGLAAEVAGLLGI